MWNICSILLLTRTIGIYGYIFNIEPKSYDDAEAWCQSIGSHLATITTQTEYDEAIAAINVDKVLGEGIGNERTWIGLNDRATEGEYVFEDGTTCTDLPAFNDGNCGLGELWHDVTTGNTGENCGQIFVYATHLGFGDFGCHQLCTFLCNDPGTYVIDETVTDCASLESFCQDTYGTDGASIHSQGEYDLAFTLCQNAIPSTSSYVLCCLGGFKDTEWEWYDASDNTLLADTTTKWSSGGLWAQSEPSSSETSLVIHAQWDDPDNLHGLHGYIMTGDVYPICNSPVSPESPLLCGAPSKFIWEELVQSETGKPNIHTNLSIEASTLTLKIVVSVDYLGASAADNNDYVYGTTYVVDFEDFNAHKDDITQPGTCQNREDVLSGASWDDLWDYSSTPNEAGGVGSLDHLAYPPGGVWTVEMDPDDVCGTVRYSTQLTWDELTQCTSHDGIQYIGVDGSATDKITLSGTLYVNVVSPFAYQSDYHFYRVYQLLSQPFEIQVSKTVYVLDKTGINLLTIDIIAVYKEENDYDDGGKNKFVLIVLTESAEYLQLSRATLGGALISFDPDTETGLQTSDFAVSLTTENTGCLQNKDYICSQLWQIDVVNAKCSKESQIYTDFSGSYSIGFNAECRNDVADTQLMDYCATWLDGDGEVAGHRAEIENESGLIVLDANLIWKDEICEPLLFEVQFNAVMRFFTSDAYSTASQASDTHLFMVGTDIIYVSVTTEYPSDHFSVFNTELMNVWICTFDPLQSPDEFLGHDVGGCYSTNKDSGVFDGHDGHIYDNANGVKLEGFEVDTSTPQSNIVQFEFVVPSRVARDKLYVHAQIEVSLTDTGTDRRRRRVLMAAMHETNQMNHFVDKIGIKRSSPPIDNPKPVNINNYPPPQQPFVISLESPWVIGIGCLLALVLTVNIVFMCYMNCNKRRMYSPIKYQDSEFDDSSERDAINVVSD